VKTNTNEIESPLLQRNQRKIGWTSNRRL